MGEQLIIAKISWWENTTATSSSPVMMKRHGNAREYSMQVVASNNLYHKYIFKCMRAEFDLCPTTHITYNHQTEFTGYFNYVWKRGEHNLSNSYKSLNENNLITRCLSHNLYFLWTISFPQEALSIRSLGHIRHFLDKSCMVWKHGTPMFWDKDNWHFLRQDRSEVWKFQ